MSCHQKAAVHAIRQLFPDSKLDDRTIRPSYGYRAFHVIVRYQDSRMEVQVRTQLQHWWAELSEKLSDALDPAIKYGGGPEEVRNTLLGASESISRMESVERTIAESSPVLGETWQSTQLELLRDAMITALQCAVATIEARRQ
jgi:putative GTP pyrophosphokinase